MSWFGSRTPWDAVTNQPVVNPFFEPPGKPLPGLIPKWPEPNTSRVNGQIRWLSEPQLYPLATRWYGIVFYDTRAGASALPLWQFAEYFWVDLVYSDPLTLSATTAVSPYGTQATIEFRYTNLGAPFGDGFQATYDISATGEPAVTYITKNPIQRYDSPLTQSDTGGTVSPSYNNHWLTGSYPFIWMNLFPMATCYPTTAMKAPDAMYYVTYGRSTNGLSLVGGVYIPWETVVDSTIPTILDPGDATKMVVPAGYSFAKFTQNFARSSSAQDVAARLHKNGSTFGAGGFTTNASNPASEVRNNASSAWIPVVPGDFFQLWMSSAGGTLQGAGGGTWISVELQ